MKSNCPSCGGLVEFQSTVSLLAVCPHCRSALIRKDLNLETLGEVAELQKDSSLIQLGVRGEYKRVPFSVVGRIQLKYESGFWNEWFIAFQDGTSAWLGEAMGDYMISTELVTQDKLPSEDKLEPGMNVKINGKDYSISDIEEAAYVSIEGELPSEVPLGESATFADLANSDGGFGTLDFSESPCTVYTGEYVDFEDFKFQGLKNAEVR